MINRFVFDPSIYHFTDTKTGKTYCEYNLDKVVDILNEQDKTIQKLETELCPLIHHDKLMSGLNKGQELYINELNGTIKKLQEENQKLRDLLYESQETIINEYSSHITKDMNELERIINGPIDELEKFVSD